LGWDLQEQLHTDIEFFSLKIAFISKPEKTGFPGFRFSATRNPVFKFFPRIGNTKHRAYIKYGMPITMTRCISSPYWRTKLSIDLYFGDSLIFKMSLELSEAQGSLIDLRPTKCLI